MYATGDAVVHPVLGAGIVIDLTDIELQTKNQQYYKIRILGTTKTIFMIPVKSAEEVGLRPAISSLELAKVWQTLSASAKELPDDNKLRYRILEEKLKIAQIMMMAEIVRDLEWRRIQKKHLNRPAQRVFEQAMVLLAGEIAVSLDVKMQSAREQIHKVLEANFSDNLAQ